MNSVSIDHGNHRDRTQCLTGVFHLQPTGLIGATIGTISNFGFRFPVRQVPGPNNQGIPLAQADGMQVRVCGVPVPDGPNGNLVLQVSLVQPLLLQ